MLYHLLYPLHTVYPFLNLFRYITFRTIYASLTALLITLIFTPWLIKKFAFLKVGQHIRDDGPATHLRKEGTPTMGGMLILFSLIFSTLMWVKLDNHFIWIVLGVTSGYGILGLIDDYKKLVNKNSRGLSVLSKIFFQTIIACAAATFLYLSPNLNTQLSIPFLKMINPDLGWIYCPFAVLVIVGTSNAVNLTDGLDGLAIGPLIIAASAYLLFAYISGNIKIANYLQVPYVPCSGELAVFCGAMAGSGMGFLWYNTYPAQIFMGDVGSLALGGALGTVALITKNEILLIIIGGIFVVETISVIFQVGSYKLRKKRIFKMAPIHHHFELKGWDEPKIIVRFWIISIILALIAISTLKLR